MTDFLDYPYRWYWQVAASPTQVYSSAVAGYVPVADAAYVGWLADGNVATQISLEAELWEVLYQQYPAGLTAAVFNALSNTKANTLLDTPAEIVKLLRGLVELMTTELNNLYNACPRLVSSITRAGTVATVTTPVAHGLTTGRNVIVFGCDVPIYNGQKAITVTSPTTFTYPGVTGAPATPAVGSPAYQLTAASLPEPRTVTVVKQAIKDLITSGSVD